MSYGAGIETHLEDGNFGSFSLLTIFSLGSRLHYFSSNTFLYVGSVWVLERCLVEGTRGIDYWFLIFYYLLYCTIYNTYDHKSGRIKPIGETCANQGKKQNNPPLNVT